DTPRQKFGVCHATHREEPMREVPDRSPRNYGSGLRRSSPVLRLPEPRNLV
ncbi:MAG: hypothetical protein AVDCRST_MAG93-9790, partial [uncultured Chloroflexia bacterium]